MAYEKTTWAAGDKVTAAKLNNLETGVFNATPFLIHLGEGGALDQTWQEIRDLLEAGRFVSVPETYQSDSLPGETDLLLAPVLFAGTGFDDAENTGFLIMWNSMNGPQYAFSSTKDGYPVLLLP